MKIRNVLVLTVLSCMLVLSGCKKEKGGIPDHLKVIPANSAMVMTINAKELVEKGGLNSYEDFEIYKKAHQDLVRYEPETTKLMDEFLKDTRNTGFDLDQIYMYIQPLGEYNQLTAFTFGVDNSNKAGKWLEKVSKQLNSNEDDSNTVIKEKGYSYFRFDYSTLIIWDDTKAMLLPIREYDEAGMPSFESLLSIDEEHSIVSNPDFMASYNAQKDFTFWMSIKKLIEMNGGDSPELSYLSQLYGEEWKDASLDISLNFTNEKAALNGSFWPLSLVEKMKKEYPILKADFDESLLRYFPKDYFLVMKASLNIQEYYRVMVDKLSSMTKELEGKDNDDYDYYSYNPLNDYEYMSQLLSMVDNEDVAEIVNLFKGDIVADIFGFQEGMIPMPQFGVALTINGEQAFNQLLELLPNNITLTKIDSYYSYEIPQVTTIYAGQKGDVMYVTNSTEAITNFYAQGYKDNLGSSGVVSYMKESPAIYSLNTDISSYPAIATTMLRQSMGSMEYSIFANIMEPFSSINLMQSGDNTVELNLMLKNNKENSFKVMLKAIDRYASNMMGF